MQKVDIDAINKISEKSEKHDAAINLFFEFLVRNWHFMRIAVPYAMSGIKYDERETYSKKEVSLMYCKLPHPVQIGFFLQFIADHFGESEPLHSFYSDFKQTIDACFDQIANGNDKMHPDSTPEKKENQNAEKESENINQSNQPKFVWATSVGNLRKALEGLEDERMIMTQVCTTNGKAVFVSCKFYFEAVGGSSFSFLSCEHPELIDLVSASDIKDCLPINPQQPKNILGEWQLCPKCNGNKVTQPNYNSTNMYQQCDICLGAGILAKPVITNQQ